MCIILLWCMKQEYLLMSDIEIFLPTNALVPAIIDFPSLGCKLVLWLGLGFWPRVDNLVFAFILWWRFKRIE